MILSFYIDFVHLAVLEWWYVVGKLDFNDYLAEKFILVNRSPNQYSGLVRNGIAIVCFIIIKRIIITLLTVRIGIYWTHRKSGIYREQWWCSPKRAVKPLLNFSGNRNVKDSVQLLSTRPSRQCHENSWPGGHSPASMINLEIKNFFNWQVVRSKFLILTMIFKLNLGLESPWKYFGNADDFKEN